HLPELDVEIIHLGGEACLPRIFRLGIKTKHPRGTASLHLHRIESGVAANVEHRLAGQIDWDRIREWPPFDGREVAQEMRGRGAYAFEIDIVKPRRKRIDLPLDLCPRKVRLSHARTPS